MDRIIMNLYENKQCGIKFYGFLFLKKLKLKIYNQEVDAFS